MPFSNTLAAVRRERHDHAAPVLDLRATRHDALRGELWQKPRQARRMHAAAPRELVDLARLRVDKRADDSPLLIGEAACMQLGTEALRHRPTRPQQQHRQRAAERGHAGGRRNTAARRGLAPAGANQTRLRHPPYPTSTTTLPIALPCSTVWCAATMSESGNVVATLCMRRFASSIRVTSVSPASRSRGVSS